LNEILTSLTFKVKYTHNHNTKMNDKIYNYDMYEHYDLALPKDRYMKKGLSGLINLGNKCFMVSILQCLSHTLKLTDYFLNCTFLEDDPDKANKRKNEYYLIMSYTQLLSSMWEKNQLLKPKSFTENLSKFVKKYYTTDQQDSHECLLYILDLLHKGISYDIDVQIKGEVKTPVDALIKKSLESWKQFYENNYSFIVEVFHGLFMNRITCQSCKFSELVFEPYNCWNIDIPDSSTSLYDCLQNYFNTGENIMSWKCEKCNDLGCQKTCSAWTIPTCVIIHLKRFSNNGIKKNTVVDFPIDNLNLTPFVSKDKNDPNNYIYSLYAVNYHSGSANAGHYWSCCKNLDNNWYMFNDGNVTKFNNIADLLSKDAYILMYYRKYIKKAMLV
jgi:ubiquitin carboxyl-terminal hydrolase 8